jgi:hypothetical protein
MQSSGLVLEHRLFLFRKSGSIFIAAILAAVLLGVGVASSASAEGTQSFSGAPSDGTQIDSTRTTFTYSAAPGQSLSDSYILINDGTVAQDIRILASDAFNAGDGSFSLLDTNAPVVDVGTWVTFDGIPNNVITIEPGGSKVVPFVVNIPADARPGDHVGGIIASVSSVDGQVKLERRVATRLYVRVSGDLQAGLTVSGLGATYEPSLNPFSGKLVLTYTVKNSGNVVLGSKGFASVTGLFGMPLSGKTDFSVPELLPGATHNVTTEVPGVWQWVWMNAQLSLIGTDGNEALNAGVMPTANREASTWAVPWALLVALMLGGFVVLYIRFSRMNNERRSQQWIDYTEAEARLRAREESPES